MLKARGSALLYHLTPNICRALEHSKERLTPGVPQDRFRIAIAAMLAQPVPKSRISRAVGSRQEPVGSQYTAAVCSARLPNGLNRFDGCCNKWSDGFFRRGRSFACGPNVGMVPSLQPAAPRHDGVAMERGQRQHSHLFTVRLWAEDLGDGQAEWRGKVEHVTSGEAHYFRDWSGLVAMLVAMLPDVQIARPPARSAGAPSDEEASPSV
jgi:hypothetical protein